MGEVVDLDDYRPVWMLVTERCPCGWVAGAFVHHEADFDRLECGRCHEMTAAVMKVHRTGERLRLVRDG